jgi:hypothetical protein
MIDPSHQSLCYSLFPNMRMDVSQFCFSHNAGRRCFLTPRVRDIGHCDPHSTYWGILSPCTGVFVCDVNREEREIDRQFPGEARTARQWLIWRINPRCSREGPDWFCLPDSKHDKDCINNNVLYFSKSIVVHFTKMQVRAARPDRDSAGGSSGQINWVATHSGMSRKNKLAFHPDERGVLILLLDSKF